MTQEEERNFDTLTVSVRCEREEEIERAYAALGWTQTERTEDARYSDLAVLRLRRPHKIPHKDRLQLLQVYLEQAYNTLAIREKYKWSRSLSLGLSCGLLGITAIVAGVLCAVKAVAAAWLVCGVLTAAAGVLCAAVTAWGLRVLVPRDRTRLQKCREEANAQIAYVFAQAAALREETNGERA